MMKHPGASQKLKGVTPRDASYHPIPLSGPISRSFHPGVLIAGDAAQQVKPTTGGGIVFSLICARAAGEVAHQAAEKGDTSNTFLSKYERRWRREIGTDLNAMRQIRRMLFRLPDRHLDRIFSFAHTVGAANVLDRADDIDMQGRALARLGLDPRLAISMLYSGLLSLPFLADGSEPAEND
jgi:flavin-dependent dehydrogenase